MKKIADDIYIFEKAEEISKVWPFILNETIQKLPFPILAILQENSFSYFDAYQVADININMHEAYDNVHLRKGSVTLDTEKIVDVMGKVKLK